MEFFKMSEEVFFKKTSGSLCADTGRHSALTGNLKAGMASQDDVSLLDLPDEIFALITEFMEHSDHERFGILGLVCRRFPRPRLRPALSPLPRTLWASKRGIFQYFQAIRF